MTTVVEFPWTYPYKAFTRAEPEPVVPLRLYVGARTYDFLVLVDTGAERTLLDGISLRAAGIDIFEGTPIRFSGFLGAGLTAYEHSVRIQVANVDLDLHIAFTSQPLARQVLGRDILYFFTLGLRDRSLEILLAPEDAP